MSAWDSDYNKKEDNKKKPAAVAFPTTTKGLNPPNQFKTIQKKDEKDEEEKKNIDKVKDGASTAKDVIDYAEYGDRTADVIKHSKDGIPGSTGKDLIKNAAKKKFQIDPSKNALGFDKKGYSPGPGDDAGTGLLKKGGKKMQIAGDALEKGGKALDYVSIGIDLYKGLDAVKNNNRGAALKHGTDAAASFIGMFGPVGAAFSVGYEIGGYMDKKIGLSKEINKEVGLEEKAKNSAESKIEKTQRASRLMELSIEQKQILDSEMKTIRAWESTRMVLKQSLVSLLSGYENDHEIPEFNKTKPNILNFNDEGYVDYSKLSGMDGRARLEFMLDYIRKLKAYRYDLQNYAGYLSRLVKLASKESKKINLGNKTLLTPSGKGKDHTYRKYNEDGNIMEEGTVQVNKRGKIIGGKGIRKVHYNKKGEVLGETKFDFTKKGKQKEDPSSGIIIY